MQDAGVGLEAGQIRLQGRFSQGRRLVLETRLLNLRCGLLGNEDEGISCMVDAKGDGTDVASSSGRAEAKADAAVGEHNLNPNQLLPDGEDVSSPLQHSPGVSCPSIDASFQVVTAGASVVNPSSVHGPVQLSTVEVAVGSVTVASLLLLILHLLPVLGARKGPTAASQRRVPRGPPAPVDVAGLAAKLPEKVRRNFAHCIADCLFYDCHMLEAHDIGRMHSSYVAGAYMLATGEVTNISIPSPLLPAGQTFAGRRHVHRLPG